MRGVHARAARDRRALRRPAASRRRRRDRHAVLDRGRDRRLRHPARADGRQLAEFGLPERAARAVSRRDAAAVGGDPGDQPERRRLLPVAEREAAGARRRDGAQRRPGVRPLPHLLPPVRDRGRPGGAARLGLLRGVRGGQGRGQRAALVRAAADAGRGAHRHRALPRGADAVPVRPRALAGDHCRAGPARPAERVRGAGAPDRRARGALARDRQLDPAEGARRRPHRPRAPRARRQRGRAVHGLRREHADSRPRARALRAREQAQGRRARGRPADAEGRADPQVAEGRRAGRRGRRRRGRRREHERPGRRRTQALADAKAQLGRLEQQIAARTRALPLYKETLATDGLAEELRTRRDHPVHTLLRRMYHELRSAAEAKEKQG